MKICCLQMEVTLGQPQENFSRAAQQIHQAMARERYDVLVLPECWNTGFFPKENLADLADPEGKQTQALMGELAAQYNVNIVAGSVATTLEGKVYNTAYVFDRTGNCIARYCKTHLFSPMEEDRYFTPGSSLCRFTLDGVACGVLLCYDLRFPELSRSLALQGMDVLFLPCQWPTARIDQLHILLRSRAVENQCFALCCNACGTAGETVFGGNSLMVDPLGSTVAQAGSESQLSGCLKTRILPQVRSNIPVFRDRRPELYNTP